MIFKRLFSLTYSLLQGLLLCAACGHAYDVDHIQTDSAPQKSRYVSVTGNDQNKGTESQPFRTISRALDAISAGDTIFVREGAYHEKLLISKIRKFNETHYDKVLSQRSCGY